ncbi:MAG TPA: N-methyl-L-tryptophan oxidase [Anaerolineales bacterium]|nr:N-methyl-L-tryptophan oxidase [Anaerolineales bacterium]
MKTTFDTIVLGLGGIGSGALYHLARRGVSVLGIEQFELGHTRGASQDHSRIIRLSYHTPAYVELAREAYTAWTNLETAAGEALILRTGGLDLFPPNGAIPMDDYTGSMRAADVEFDTLSARDVMQRWPQFNLKPDVIALFQKESGIAPAVKCSAAHLRMARAHGAAVIKNAPVSGLRSSGPDIEVEAGGARYTCRSLVITAGAWTNDVLAHFGRRLPLEVTQEQVTYYASPNPGDYAPGRFPIWIWMDEPCFYGFPVYGEAGPKVAQDVGGRVVTAETRTFEPNPDTTRRTEDFLREVLPGIPGPQIYTKTCLYTLTPDRDFILDRLPGHPNVFVTVGAGHAFKFASVLGRILSDLVIDGRSESDINAFRFDRSILQTENPPRSYMI